VSKTIYAADLFCGAVLERYAPAARPDLREAVA
jgi:hypothetical protein